MSTRSHKHSDPCLRSTDQTLPERGSAAHLHRGCHTSRFRESDQGTSALTQTILITGATDGLGRALAAEVAASGATVLAHGRRAVHDELYRADLASLEEVRELARRVEDENERLDVLVNNAGIGTAGERAESREGYELHFAVNYLAGFLLTRLLVPLLVRSAPARVVNVSSAGQAPIDFDDVMLERSYNGVQAYCQSKLAQVMFTFDLAEELRDQGVTVNCLHPATYMPTKMVKEAGATPVSSLEEGVEATRRLVDSPDLDGVTGRYFNGQQEAHAHPQAYDDDARRKLRELSERLTQ
jgi:NAD(P)-dependent dehydrogenase (short-subunit alcohol dehydrogenase family)